MIQDQAVTLRQMVRLAELSSGSTAGRTGARVIAVSSGKGGVGKTNLVVNLAIAWARSGHRVAVLDADLGLANVDVLMGLAPQYTLADLIAGDRCLEEIVISGSEGVLVIPGASGLQSMVNLEDDARNRIIRALATLDESVDVVLIDTAAGVDSNVSSFALAAHEVLVVTTPEPTAFTDAYALIKVIATASPSTTFKLVVNQAANSREAVEVAKRLALVARQFLGVAIEDLGYLPTDTCVTQAVRRQVPLMVAYPRSRLATLLFALSQRLWNEKPAISESMGLLSFVRTIARRERGAGD